MRKDTTIVRDLDAEVRAKRLDKGLKEAYMTVMMRENEKYRQGREEGREEGFIRGVIETMRKMGCSDGDIAEKVNMLYPEYADKIEDYLNAKV